MISFAEKIAELEAEGYANAPARQNQVAAPLTPRAASDF